MYLTLLYFNINNLYKNYKFVESRQRSFYKTTGWQDVHARRLEVNRGAYRGDYAVILKLVADSLRLLSVPLKYREPII